MVGQRVTEGSAASEPEPRMRLSAISGLPPHQDRTFRFPQHVGLVSHCQSTSCILPPKAAIYSQGPSEASIRVSMDPSIIAFLFHRTAQGRGSDAPDRLLKYSLCLKCRPIKRKDLIVSIDVGTKPSPSLSPSSSFHPPFKVIPNPPTCTSLSCLLNNFHHILRPLRTRVRAPVITSRRPPQILAQIWM